MTQFFQNRLINKQLKITIASGVSLIFLVGLSAGCASLTPQGSTLDFSKATHDLDRKQAIVPMNKIQKSTTINTQAGNIKVNWLECTLAGAKTKSSYVLLVHPEDNAFSAPAPCNSPLLQSFARQGLNIVALSHSQLYGENLDHFTTSISTLKAIFKTLNKLNKSIGKLKYVWSYGEASLTTLYALKKDENKSTDFTHIIGSGYFDLENISKNSRSPCVKQRLQYLGAKIEAFFDEYSIIYDLDGLPKNLMIYHGDEDRIVPANQSQAFADALRIEEYQVVYERIKGFPHFANDSEHAIVVNYLLKKK